MSGCQGNLERGKNLIQEPSRKYVGYSVGLTGRLPADVKECQAWGSLILVILGTPEPNNGIPGVSENAIDCASWPAGAISRVFKQCPFAIMAPLPEASAQLFSSFWPPVSRTSRVQFWTAGHLMVFRTGKSFNTDGEISDPDKR